MLEFGFLLLLATTLGLALYALRLRQKQAELVKEKSELRQSSETLSRFTESIMARESAVTQVVGEAIIILNIAREVVYFNDSAQEIFRRTDLTGQRFADLAWGMDLNSFVTDALTTRAETIQQTVVQDQRALLARARPIGVRGEYGVVIAFQDVTELQRLGRARRDFVANISHELRTPLASIKLLVETLINGALQDRKLAPELLAKIDAEVDALKQLSDELFDLAQIESGQAPLKLTTVGLAGLIETTLARYAMLAERHQVILQAEPSGPMDVLVDAGKFDKVLGNLIHNACKFTPPGGCVTVGAQILDDMIEIRVQDTGQGIPAQDLPRIFERFYKVDRARTRGEKGTGLGLAIARHIVEAHGGKIRVESIEGRGATFYFTVPRP